MFHFVVCQKLLAEFSLRIGADDGAAVSHGNCG